MNEREVIERFSYHPPKGDQQERYEEIRRMVRRLALTIVSLTPESREQSRALTALDDVMFNANAAIARNEQWVLRDTWVRADESINRLRDVKAPEGHDCANEGAGESIAYTGTAEGSLEGHLARERKRQAEAQCKAASPLSPATTSPTRY